MSAPRRPPAVLVSVQTPDRSDEQHAADLAELTRLVDTLGYDVVDTVSQRREGLSKALVLGEGKLKELAALTGGRGHVASAVPIKKDKARQRRGEGVDDEPEAIEEEEDEYVDPSAPRRPKFVIVDHEITPNQARNLESATGATVLDRTGVIVEIFHRHARSKEARLQVELARLAYVAPRLREAGGPSEHQAGRGSGESALELDRRRIRDRMAEIRHELAAIQRDQGTRRGGRHNTPTVALVGYTNAGKSSLMRGLTGSEVLVADQLFATLDTTVRALHPESHPRILVSDTVGFIQKLPHDLVASFRSTLDEARSAALLLYVLDASDPTFRHEYEVTRSVLREIEADQAPSLVLLNKIDRVDEALREALRAEFPDAIQLSAKDPADVARLRQTIIEHVAKEMTEAELFVPYKSHGLIASLHEHALVLRETHEEEGTRIVVRAPEELLERLRGQLAAEG
ncbi:MAG: GTPase HflX [Nannocystis sp.]|uniref:GTPase HflX n=1 Tax=Nannocystis sp. TaxID=1962667 RepID=UPI0024248023|nr:GTPase HflX [Nannocystis sp.]MBK9755670.1 GTPase HflX [Nannocystis sp.]